MKMTITLAMDEGESGDEFARDYAEMLMDKFPDKLNELTQETASALAETPKWKELVASTGREMTKRIIINACLQIYDKKGQRGW